MSDIKIKFGDTVKRLRQEKGVSQEKLAELSKLHRTYIGFIERKERNVTITTAEKVARALDMSLAQIFYEMDKGSEN